jgi:hypothetical protein
MRVSRPEYGIAAELPVLSARRANPLRVQLQYFGAKNRDLKNPRRHRTGWAMFAIIPPFFVNQ